MSNPTQPSMHEPPMHEPPMHEAQLPQPPVSQSGPGQVTSPFPPPSYPSGFGQGNPPINQPPSNQIPNQPSVKPNQQPVQMPPINEQTVSAAVQLTKVYGSTKTQVVALRGVNLNIQRGTFTAIMGPSGSGKSTLMHCLAGLDRFEQGRVFLGGVELNTLPERQLTALRRDRVGFVFQAFNLLPTMTAKQNIMLPLDLAGRKPEPGYFDHLVGSLNIQDRLDHRPSELSGGQQQRVAIARAMISRPEVVFADEPTGALDTKASNNLLTYMRASCDNLGQTFIMVTHDPKAAAFADRALILVDGQIVNDIAKPNVDEINQVLNEVQ